MMPGAKVNLLIADDEPSIRRAFSEIFTEFGYSVRSAEDGFTALVAIEREGMAHPKELSSLQLPSTQAPAWIPNNGHGSSGYAHTRFTCPECLKAFSKDLDKAICPAYEAGYVYCYSFDLLRSRPAETPAVFAGF